MDYMTAIGLGFPGVQAQCFGNPFVYENIQWVGGNPLPSKQTLDEWIASNQSLSNNTMITVLAFRNRFTQPEKLTIEMASLDNPTGTAQQRQMAAMLRVFTTDVAVATFIDLSRLETRQGVMMLEQAGIIGTGRALQILDTPPAAIELTSFTHN